MFFVLGTLILCRHSVVHAEWLLSLDSRTVFDERTKIAEHRNLTEREPIHQTWYEFPPTPSRSLLPESVFEPEYREEAPVDVQFISPAFAAGQHPHAAHSQHPDWYEWQFMPPGLLYRSYLAGEKEPRFGWSAFYDTKSQRTLWETALGGRVGLVRYGSPWANNAEGFQLDFEGAVFARLLPNEPSTMLEGADFRFGLLATWRQDRLAAKAGYYHISSHIGDEFLIANPTFPRINYVRDAAIVGLMYDLAEDLQIYGEVANAIGSQGGAEPWEFQFGAQYIPTGWEGFKGAPYAGINTYLRQDFNFQGSLNVIVGWNWIGERTGERFRIGMQYYNGHSLQYSFFDRRERLIGGGMWFDY